MNTKKWLVPISLTITLFATAGVVPAFAQFSPQQQQQVQQLQQQPESQTAPGAIQEGQVRPLQRQTSPEEAVQRRQPEAQVEEGQEQPGGAAAPAAEAQKVHINEIILEGITVLDPEVVAATIAPYENADNTFADLQELTDKLTTLYRDGGYVTSRVYIPPQKLVDGILVLRASEGIMGQLYVDEGRWYREKALRYRFPMETGENFNVEDLKRGLRRINENPDMNARAVLRAGELPRETDVTLKVTDRFPVHLIPSFDNMGRRLIGDNRLGARLVHNNLFGYGDMLSAATSFTRRSFGVVTRYETPLNEHGTRVGFDFAHSNLTLGEEFKALDVKGTADTYSPFISQEFVNRETWKLYGDFAFDFKEMDTDILDQDFSQDQLRVLRFGLNLEEFDEWGRWFVRNEIGWGVDLFGATSGYHSNPSRVGAGSKFFRYTGSVIRTQRMPWNTFGIFRAIGQFTPDRLVSAEQFQAGGAFTVRGYREGAIIGDTGFFISGEWRVPLFFVPDEWKVPFTDDPLKQNVQLVTFLDFGSAFINDPAPGIDPNEYVLGAGVGVRARLTRFLVGRLDLGFPLLRQPPFSQEPRLHVGIQSELF